MMTLNSLVILYPFNRCPNYKPTQSPFGSRDPQGLSLPNYRTIPTTKLNNHTHQPLLRHDDFPRRLAFHIFLDDWTGQRGSLDLFLAGVRRDDHAVAHLAIDLHRRSEEHTSELQSPTNLVCRLLL